MIAIIIAAAAYPEMYGLDEHLPVSLLQLVDRPILHHIVEYLVVQGISHFEFVLNHLPGQVEASLGSGARWGCTFAYHLYPTTGNPYRLAQTIAAGRKEDILLGCVDRLPEFQLAAQPPATVFLGPTGAWTGWAIFPRGSNSIDGIESDAKNSWPPADFAKVTVPQELDFRSAGGLLHAQNLLLMGTFSGLMIGGRQTEPGVWISRNVSLHPTVKLIAPASIGPNCRIGRGVSIGPSAVIAENCILDEQSSVENSLVAPGTYIGQGLELEQVIVDRNRLVNVKIGTSLLVSETFLLSSLTEHTTHHPVQQLFSRMVALVFLILFWPVTALIFSYITVFKKGSLCHDPAIRIPADDNPSCWHEYWIPRFRLNSDETPARWAGFFLQLWPGLLAVMRGELYLVGVKPRSRLEVERLPYDWRSIYLKSKSGLITEASVMFGESPSDDELYTAEAYYSATESVSHDAALVFLYLWKLITGPGKAPASFAQDSQ